MHLKKMKYHTSFTKEMSLKIEDDAVYFNYYENPSINYKLYGYIRFFNSGQYAIFSSNKENVDVNDIQKASIVGYYNIKNDVLLLEVPNTSFSIAGKSVIRKFRMIQDTLIEKRKKGETERIFNKIKIKNLKPIYPDW